MSIPGVRDVESSSIKKIKVKLDPSFTNGHDFCELIIDETNNRFTAIYGGESYTNCWGAPGVDFPKFLSNIFSNNREYLFGKIADYSKSDYVDTEETAKHLKKLVLDARRSHYLDTDEAREAWEDVERFEGLTSVTQEGLYDSWSRWFELLIAKDIVSDEPWFEDFIQYKEDRKCRIFCEKVAPLLAEVIKLEYQIAA